MGKIVVELDIYKGFLEALDIEWRAEEIFIVKKLTIWAIRSVVLSVEGLVTCVKIVKVTTQTPPLSLLGGYSTSQCRIIQSTKSDRLFGSMLEPNANSHRSPRFSKVQVLSTPWLSSWPL